MAQKKGLVACYYFDGRGLEPVYKRPGDVIRERNSLRVKAHEMAREINDPEVKHIMYYADKRTEKDQLWQAIFYPNMRFLTDEELATIDEMYAVAFYGFIGAVHI